MEIERAKSDGDFAAAARAARATYALLPDFVQQTKRQWGRWDIQTSHAVHTAPALMAVIEDEDGLRELRAVLRGNPSLRTWLPAADEADEDLALVRRILPLVHAEPGIMQSSLGKRLELAHAGRAAQLVAWLEKGGRLQRVKTGSSYRLYPVAMVVGANARVSAPSPSGTGASSEMPPTIAALAHVASRFRSSRRACHAVPLAFDTLPIVRLPMAPPTWEVRVERENAMRAGADDDRAGEGVPPLGVRFHTERADWVIADEVKLPMSERPDPAFKEVHHTAGFTHWIDPKGKREGYPTARAVLRVTDRLGGTVAERGLTDDVYRSDVSPDGAGLLCLSREGVLHGYDDQGTPFLREQLAGLPEYRAQAERLGIEDRDLRTHVRAVALSADRRLIVVAIVDEAWCIDAATGDVRWGLRMPTKEGWARRIADRSSRTGTSAEVEAALHLMELTLPVSPEDLTRQYRVLAKRWHPDRNPEDRSATQRFQHLGAAMELLTGADLTTVPSREIDHVTYERVLHTMCVRRDRLDALGRPISIDLDVTVSMFVGELFAADWVYAANIGHDGRTFLASYGGKVVIVSPAGIPERVYDIGAIPRAITDVGDRLLILTDTRLYIVSGDQLVALTDVYGAADVIITDTGFAVLEGKRLAWYDLNGALQGTVRSKDPMRRAYATPHGLIIETRQHRATVHGAPAWRSA